MVHAGKGRGTQNAARHAARHKMRGAKYARCMLCSARGIVRVAGQRVHVAGRAVHVAGHTVHVAGHTVHVTLYVYVLHCKCSKARMYGEGRLGRHVTSQCSNSFIKKIKICTLLW